MMQYPRNVYKSAEKSLSVANPKEHDAALEAGWFDTVPEALSGKREPRVKLSATVYKEVGGKMESFETTPEEAKMFMEADGWHASPADATRAAIKAEWPTDEAGLDAIMGDLGNKTKAEVTAYAKRIGATVADNAKLVDILQAVRSRLASGKPE